MVDRDGLLHDGMEGLRPFQQKLTHRFSDIESWSAEGGASLADVVRVAKPDAIIGVSGQPGLFTQEIIREYGCQPRTSHYFPSVQPYQPGMEALPEDIIKWTKGKALIATGSPFEPVQLNDRSYPIAQCNNIYIFPGLGLGILASGATRITDTMLDIAVETLALAVSSSSEPGSSTAAFARPHPAFYQRHCSCCCTAGSDRIGLAVETEQ